MKIFKVNILSKDILKTADAICFTSNGVIKKDGRLVMGAGVAKQFRDTFPDLDQASGIAVKEYGNVCQIVKQVVYLGHTINILAFPTKHNWKDKSDIKLIEKSVFQLVELTNLHNWKTVYLPAPGINNGGLNWNDVKSLLEKWLDSRFTITFFT